MKKKSSPDISINTGAFIKTGNDRLELDLRLVLNVKHPMYRPFIEHLQKMQKEQKGLIIYSSGL